MFSVQQKREIAESVQEVLRATNHPELPAGEIQFHLHVKGAEAWSWADIKNNGSVPAPRVNPHNERQDPRNIGSPVAGPKAQSQDSDNSERAPSWTMAPDPENVGNSNETAAVHDVLAERRRQIAQEGWTSEHDDEHDAGELAAAGSAYAISAVDQIHPYSQGDGHNAQPTFWPWSPEWWKPTTPRRDLVKAAALILAEIEKIDRTAVCNAEVVNG